MWKAFFVFMGSLFWVLPPPRTKLSACAHEYMELLRTRWGLMPPLENSYKIARLEYIFDKISAFAKYSWGMHSRETLFKWCNLVCFRV